MKCKIILKTSINTISRVENCINTWLRDQDYVCLTDTLTGKYNEISGSIRTDYYSAEEKTLHLINLLIETNTFDEYDWLAFIDDDAIFNTKMFNYIMPFLDKTKVYGLLMRGVYDKAPNVTYPSGGSGYFISPSLCKGKQLMIDNKWGIEDAALGLWLKQNNIPLVDNFIINDTLYHLYLNGWFPFNKEREMLPKSDFDHPTRMPEGVINNITNHDEKRKELIRYMTHHYIRWKPLMDYIYFKIFNTWTPEDLVK